MRNENTNGRSCRDQSCEEEACQVESCNEWQSECEMTNLIMQLGNEAWAALMKEKMKKKYEETIGKQMDKVAAVGVEGCCAYWKAKMQSKAGCQAFEEALQKAFMP